MQYLSLIIPVIFIVIGLVKFKKSLLWWEYLVVFFVPVMFVILSTLIIKNQIPESTEAFNYHSTYVQYDEQWDEWIEKECKERYACGTESYSYSCGKNRCTGTRTQYCTRKYDCSYREFHPARWTMDFSDGNDMSISSNEFEARCSMWGNRKFVDMKRDYYKIDGDRYVCNWNRDTMKLVTKTSPHEYENRLLASNNIMGFRKIDSVDVARYGLFKSPTDEFSTTTEFRYIVGDNSPTANQYLAGKNGTEGAAMQLTMLMVVYNNSLPDVCEMTEAYWFGGKKNELVLCMNIKDGKVANAKVITWAKSELMKVKIRDSVVGRPKYDALESAKIMAYFVDRMWQRRDFKEFDYIEVEMELQWYHHLMIWIVVVLLSSGLGWWVVNNEFKPEERMFEK